MPTPNTWDLTYFYKTEEAFEADLALFKEKVALCAKYEGQLQDEEKLHEYLLMEREINILLSRLYFFVSMRSDRNKKNIENASALSKVRIALNDYIRTISFEEPELLSLGEEKLHAFIEKYDDMKEFSFIIEKLFRGQRYVMTADKEALLSAYGPLLSEASSLYSMLSVADYSPKQITLSDGEEVSVSQANWTSLITKAKTAEDRKAIFEALYSYSDAHKNAYAEIYNTGLQSQLAIQRSRGYDSILQEHLFHNAIPESVFHNLIEVASQGSAPLKKYYQLRKKALGLEAHRSYDRFLKLAKSEKQYTYEQAKELFWASIQNFPADFQEKAPEVLRDGFVDVYPGDGKRTGAYSNGGASFHPYILLNFMGELDDVFTLAHESGHSIHTMYSEESQPIMKQDYTIFVAEIASTFNEHNLLDYLLTHEQLSKDDKIYLLQKAIDEICATFYRQTLFGHYEYLAAEKAQKGEPINHEVLSGIMTDLYKQYYGIDITEEVYKPLVWAYIPHLFNSPFYVYQYATSFTSSMLIYEKVKEGKEGAFDQYISLLRSGGSDFPVEQVKKAGVDLTTKEPFLAVTRRMEELVDQLEKLLNE